MNGVTYKTTELELASFLKARGHRFLFARLDGRVVDSSSSKRVVNKAREKGENE